MTINIHLKRDRVFYLSFILALFSLVSCEKQPVLTFGQNFTADNSGADVVVVDTSTILLQTVLVDSTATAGTGFLQVGGYSDSYFGKVSSEAYIQLALPALPTIGTFDTYDSIGLVMHYKKGNPYYGDTTNMESIVVNRVSSLYQLNNFQNGFFSNSSFPVDPTPLGSTAVSIAPNIPYTSLGTGDTVKIPLNKEFGRTLFNMIYNNSDTVKKSDVWLAWFHGLRLAPGDGDHKAIYGYGDSILMRIYYHQAAAFSPPKYIDFGIVNPGFQFNHIVTDRKSGGLPIKGLDTVTQIVQTPPATRSDSTGNIAYVQSSTGLNVKVTFPYLNNIALRKDFIQVLRATLTVEPVPGSFSTTWTLPPQLQLSYTDLNNLIGAPVPSASTGGAQTGNMKVDYLDLQNTVYTYDVTNFVKSEILNTNPSLRKEGFMLSVPSPNSVNSFARAVLADQSYPVNQRVTLRVYYIALYPHN